MIQCNPYPKDFLETKPSRICCEIPPFKSTLELEEMTYLEPGVTYKSIHYDILCHIVASGDLIFHDFRGSTSRKPYHIVKTSRNFFYLLNLAEQTIKEAGMVKVRTGRVYSKL